MNCNIIINIKNKYKYNVNVSININILCWCEEGVDIQGKRPMQWNHHVV